MQMSLLTSSPAFANTRLAAGVGELSVLSLFDGMSCGQIALQKAGLKVKKYYASEIDKYAIKVTQHNYPNTVQLGDVTKVTGLTDIDLLIGGSPCQGFSFAGAGLNFEDERSRLFFEFVRLKNECNPKYFLLENVKMKKEHEDVITKYLGVKPLRINSALVSAQNRERLYWTNIPVKSLPNYKNVTVKNVIDTDLPVFFTTARRDGKGIRRLADLSSKSSAITARYWKGVQSDGAPFIIFGEHKKGEQFDYNRTDYRMLTPVECERLQTVPENYTSIVSNTQRYKMLGNGWTVDVIAFILSHLNAGNTCG
jgi:site-specific DNA-cytosine methylase